MMPAERRSLRRYKGEGGGKAAVRSRCTVGGSVRLRRVAAAGDPEEKERVRAPVCGY